MAIHYCFTTCQNRSNLLAWLLAPFLPFFLFLVLLCVQFFSSCFIALLVVIPFFTDNELLASRWWGKWIGRDLQSFLVSCKGKRTRMTDTSPLWKGRRWPGNATNASSLCLPLPRRKRARRPPRLPVPRRNPRPSDSQLASLEIIEYKLRLDACVICHMACNKFVLSRVHLRIICNVCYCLVNFV